MQTGQTEAPRNPHGVRVLVVDDDQDTCRSAAMVLQLKGHETRTAFSGREAITAASAFLPEVVLLDLSMPDMDGVELARAIRKTTSIEEPAIAAVSGYDSLFHKRLCAKAGFDYFLPKPVYPAELDLLILLASERDSPRENLAELKREHVAALLGFCRAQIEFAGLVLDFAPTLRDRALVERSLAKVQRLQEKLGLLVARSQGLTADQTAALQILLKGLQIRLTTMQGHG